MILCFCLSGLMECHSKNCEALVVGGGGMHFASLNFWLFLFSRPCFLSEVYPNICPICL